MLLSFLFLIPVFASILYPPSLLFTVEFSELAFVFRVFISNLSIFLSLFSLFLSFHLLLSTEYLTLLFSFSLPLSLCVGVSLFWSIFSLLSGMGLLMIFRAKYYMLWYLAEAGYIACGFAYKSEKDGVIDWYSSPLLPLPLSSFLPLLRFSLSISPPTAF
jgi:hypothetical protein